MAMTDEAKLMRRVCERQIAANRLLLKHTIKAVETLLHDPVVQDHPTTRSDISRAHHHLMLAYGDIREFRPGRQER